MLNKSCNKEHIEPFTKKKYKKLTNNISRIIINNVYCLTLHWGHHRLYHPTALSVTSQSIAMPGFFVLNDT